MDQIPSHFLNPPPKTLHARVFLNFTASPLQDFLLDSKSFSKPPPQNPTCKSIPQLHRLPPPRVLVTIPSHFSPHHCVGFLFFACIPPGLPPPPPPPRPPPPPVHSLNTHSLTHSHFSLTHFHSLSLSFTHFHSVSLTFTHFHSLSLSLTFTHFHSLSLTHFHSLTHSHLTSHSSLITSQLLITTHHNLSHPNSSQLHFSHHFSHLTYHIRSHHSSTSHTWHHKSTSHTSLLIPPRSSH